MIGPLLLIGLVALVSSVGTRRMRRYALGKALLDIPNERSSHTEPTPRGGGAAVALSVCCGTMIGAGAGWLDWRIAATLVTGGGMVAVVGWIDDRRHVAPLHRFSVHVIAAVLAVISSAGLPVLRLGGSALSLGWFGSVLAVVGIVWLVNLYNFMDGIDGLAGTEALVVGLGGAALALLNQTPGLALASALVAAAGAGFLRWNWPPARIFLGDVGSGFFGYCFGVLALMSERAGGAPLVLWLVLLAAFIVDSTVTLLRRALKGEVVFAAHRSHAYQRAIQAGASHALVSGVVGAANLLLLLFAVACSLWPTHVLVLGLAGFMIPLLLYMAVELKLPMPETIAGDIRRE